MTTPAIDRLMKRIQVTENGCWLFTGAIDTTGYGRIGRGRRGEGSTHAHRVTFEWLWDVRLDDMHIDHLCRNRACCNPHHLDAVTQAENNQRSWDARHGRRIKFADQYASPSRASGVTA